MKFWVIGWCTAAICLASCGTASAQAIQLPTFRFFTVSTTVSVPDSGRGFMGGVKRARQSRTGLGLPLVGSMPGLGRLARNQAIGQSMSSSGVSVGATIIDHSELDAATLAEARGGRPSSGLHPAVSSQASFLARNLASHRRAEPVSPPAAAPRQPTAGELQARNERAARQRQEAIQSYIRKGQEAEAAGKHGAARIYYKNAARRADAELRSRILAHVATIGQPLTDVADAPK